MAPSLSQDEGQTAAAVTITASSPLHDRESHVPVALVPASEVHEEPTKSIFPDPSVILQDEASQSPFFRLSAELCNRIYSEVFACCPDVIELSEQHGPITPSGHNVGDKWYIYTPTSVLRTCKQIREEASAMWYYPKAFIVHNWIGEARQIFKRWWSNLTPSARENIRTVCLDHAYLDIVEGERAIKDIRQSMATKGRDISKSVLYNSYSIW